MRKVIRDGEVAVLYSPYYGAGWYTWNNRMEELLYHPKIVDMVLNGRNCEIDSEWLSENLGDEYADVFCGGVGDLKVKWLPVGSKFLITEFDGSEDIITVDDLILEA